MPKFCVLRFAFCIRMKLYSPSKISRRLGERFFFKAERDSSSKSAMIKRPYPPGAHGKSRRRAISEFGAELQEKQKIMYLYGLNDKQLKKYVQFSSRVKGKTKTRTLLERLEMRLDSVVYRLGLAHSRRIARHMVSYGHIFLNGKPSKTPSQLLSVGDSISIRESSRSNPLFEGLKVRLNKYQPPEWLGVNSEEAAGTILRPPSETDNLILQNLSKVIEYYSR